MVHALEEARRVLVPHGFMVDLRPYCLDAPLEVVHAEGIEPAGVVDTSLCRADDAAAEKAVFDAVHAGLFKELKLDIFDFAFFWKSPQDMHADINGQWKWDVVLPKDVSRRAARLYRKHPSPATLRLRIRMKMVVFEKK